MGWRRWMLVVAACAAACGEIGGPGTEVLELSSRRDALPACTVTVTPGPGTPIQAAIDAASPGDVVCVSDGETAESIHINKSLTVLGKQAGVDPVAGGRGLETKFTSSYAVKISASNVVFDGFELADFTYGVNVNFNEYGFEPPAYALSHITVAHNWIHSASATVGFTTAPGLLQQLTLTHNLIHVGGTALAAIGFSGGNSADGHPTYEEVEISYNDILNEAGYGLFSGADPATFVINGMKITGNYFRGSPWGNANIGNIQNGEVTGNLVEVTNLTVGISTGTVSGNTFGLGGRLGLWGIDPENGADAGTFTRPTANLVIENNEFKDEVNGRALYLLTDDPYADTLTIRTNAFRNTGIAPLVDPPQLEPSYPFVLTSSYGRVIVNLGNVDMQTGATVRSQALNANGNWWDSPSGWSGPGGFYGLVTRATVMTSGAEQLKPPTEWPLNTLGLSKLGFWPAVASDTSLTYGGVWLDADGNGSTTLTATLASADAACTQGKTVTFTLDGITLTGVTGTDGKVTVTWSPSAEGVYDLAVSFAGDALCTASDDTSVVTVAQPGGFASGGGWYKPTQQPVTRASFGVVASRQCSRKTGTCTVGGSLVWVHHRYNRLKSTALTAVSAATPVLGFGLCSQVAGVGALSRWDAEASGWSTPAESVPFVATVCDGGSASRKGKVTLKADAFGLQLPTVTLPGESGPVPLSGGSINVKN